MLLASTMRICYFGTYRTDYSRNQIVIEGLRRAGIEVIECQQSLWQGWEDRVKTASGGWMRPAFWLRVLQAYRSLLGKYRKVGHYDVMVVGFPGHYDVFLARWLSWLRGKPLVWDVLVSLFLIYQERGLQEKHPLTAQMIRWLEMLACRLPNILILDTDQFIHYFAEIHGADPERFRCVQIGADERYFQSLDIPPKTDDSFKVIYYGTYIPNHGVEFIIEAAHLLAGEPCIHFDLIGDGPEKLKAIALAEQYGLQNISFIDWMRRDELTQQIAHADLVLGAFGESRQLNLTNNNKIYEGFAMRKPVISARTPALPALLEHGVHLYLCERGDPVSLAEGIQHLKTDTEMRQRLSEQGYRIFYEYFDITHIGQAFASHLETLRNNDQ